MFCVVITVVSLLHIHLSVFLFTENVRSAATGPQQSQFVHLASVYIKLSQYILCKQRCTHWREWELNLRFSSVQPRKINKKNRVN